MATIRATIAAVGLRLWRWLPQLSREGWLGLAAPLSIMLMFVVSVGGETQQSIFSALNSDAPSIYDALYGNAVEPYPPLDYWLEGGIAWHYLLVAAGVVVLALRASSIRLFLVAVAFWSTILLTLMDIITFAVQGKFDLSFQLANFASNIAGGVVIALITTTGLALHKVCTTILREHHMSALILGAASLIMLGLATSTATYFALRFLYQPLPIRVAAILRAPVRGYFLGDQRPALVDRGDLPSTNFTFFPTTEMIGEINQDIIQGSAAVGWRRAPAARDFDIEVRFLADCVDGRFELAGTSPAAMVQRNVHGVDARFDSGDSNVRIVPTANSQFAFIPSGLKTYWISRENSTAPLSITLLTQPKDRITISTSEQTNVFISANLFGRVGNVSQFRPRQLTVAMDDARWSVRFERSGPVSRNSILNCRAIRIPVSPNSEETVVRTPDIDVGILLTFVPVQVPVTSLYPSPEQNLTIVGGGGMTEFPRAPTETLERSAPGYLSFLTADNVSDLRVDEREFDVRPDEDLLIVGDFQGSRGPDGQTFVSGKARAAWKGSRRLNETRWEQAKDTRLWLLGGILGCLAFVASWTWARIRLIEAAKPNSLVD